MASNFIELIKKRKKDFVIAFIVIYTLIWIFKFILGNSIYDKHKEQFAYQQAKILSSYIIEYRHHYQSLFIEKIIQLDEDTINALPAVAIVKINELFSDKNLFSINVKTVSDRPRNINNKADEFELQAMEKYKNSPNTSELFEKIQTEDEEFYQYSSPLWVQQSCLKCHSSKEKAPDYVSQKYDLGYGYKIGDLRGIVSVKIPTKNIDIFFLTQKILIFIFDFIIFILLILIVAIAYKILNAYNQDLSEEVNKKTRSLQQALHDINQYKKALDDSSIVTIADKNGIIKYVNDNFIKVSGYTKEEAIGRTHSIIKHPDVPKEVFNDMWETILSKKTWQGIIKNRTKSGGYYVVDATIEPILDINGDILEFIAVRHDITAIYDKQSQIEKMALTDGLTSLQNRKKLLMDIPKFHNPKIAIVDIDNFANINDFYGNDMGDFILKEVASILSTYTGEMTSIYRYTSDRFAIVSSLDKDSFLAIIDDIIKHIKFHNFVYKQLETRISISVAISFADKTSLLHTVDMSLSELKKHRISYMIYDYSLNIEEKIKNNIHWTSKIKSAIEEDRFICFYQPIYNNNTQKIEKYESLIRMKDIDGTIISPIKFLDFAKQSKQYIALTKKVINQSFEKFKDTTHEFSINLTIEDILSDEIRELIKDNMDNELFKGKVVYEIVESEGIENLSLVNDFIENVKRQNGKIAIDDFGTGYSNFSYLLKLTPDYIKIDGSMIKDIDKNKDHREIVQTIVNFAKVKGIKTIAEYVCSKEVFDTVVELGIDYSQGYYIDEPTSSLL